MSARGGGRRPVNTGMERRPGKFDFNSIQNTVTLKNTIPVAASQKGVIRFSETEIFDNFTVSDLEEIEQIGNGQFGVVCKMLHKPSKRMIAVKRIRSTMDHKDHRELLVKEQVNDASNHGKNCGFIVDFYGTLFYEGDCWICMELMDLDFDSFYRFVYKDQKSFVPEAIFAQIAYCVVRALQYLKGLNIMHKDVKPPNILLNRQGDIKLCDFGIAGRLIDSIVASRDAGCNYYMAPERIDPDIVSRVGGFDVRADVWALGISLYEIATGTYPYPEWKNPFDQMRTVLEGPAPHLAAIPGRRSEEMVNFVNLCLIKNFQDRPKYDKLLENPFLLNAAADRNKEVISTYFSSVLDAKR